MGKMSYRHVEAYFCEWRWQMGWFNKRTSRIMTSRSNLDPFCWQRSLSQAETCWAIWAFPKIGVPYNGWFILENHIKMDDLGYHYFRRPPSKYFILWQRKQNSVAASTNLQKRHERYEGWLVLDGSEKKIAISPWNNRLRAIQLKQPAGWWQLKYFLFSTLFGEDEPILTHIFQMGWFNHQLARIFDSWMGIRTKKPLTHSTCAQDNGRSSLMLSDTRLGFGAWWECLQVTSG